MKVSIDEVLTSEFEGGHLGPSRPNKIQIDFADRPIAFRWREIMQKLGQSIGPFDDQLKDYELWLVPHRLSVIRRQGLSEVTSLGIQIEYDLGQRTCSIISLLPSPQYKKLGGASADASWTGAFTPFGEASKETGDASGGLELIPGLRMCASAKGSVYIHTSAEVTFPIISAVGVGSTRCEWNFAVDSQPLIGRTVETWAVVATSREERDLQYRAKFYGTHRVAFFSTRIESQWINCKCLLPSSLG